MSVGFDHVDVEECTKRGVKVGHTPGVLTEAVAELTLALLLCTTRRMVEANQIVQNGEWSSNETKAGMACLWMCGRGIHDSTVGIVGLGRIGCSVAKKIRPFEPKEILYFDIFRNPKAAEYGIELVSFEDLLSRSDHIIINCALTPETKHLFNRDAFSKMKSTATVTNTSRGPVIDQEALYDALSTGKIGAAGLDVCYPEPLPADHKLLKLKNCVILPHIASATIETRVEMATMTAKNILAVLDGKPLLAEASVRKLRRPAASLVGIGSQKLQSATNYRLAGVILLLVVDLIPKIIRSLLEFKGDGHFEMVAFSLIALLIFGCTSAENPGLIVYLNKATLDLVSEQAAFWFNKNLDKPSELQFEIPRFYHQFEHQIGWFEMRIGHISWQRYPIYELLTSDEQRIEFRVIRGAVQLKGDWLGTEKLAGKGKFKSDLSNVIANVSAKIEKTDFGKFQLKKILCSAKFLEGAIDIHDFIGDRLFLDGKLHGFLAEFRQGIQIQICRMGRVLFDRIANDLLMKMSHASPIDFDGRPSRFQANFMPIANPAVGNEIMDFVLCRHRATVEAFGLKEQNIEPEHLTVRTDGGKMLYAYISPSFFNSWLHALHYGEGTKLLMQNQEFPHIQYLFGPGTNHHQIEFSTMAPPLASFNQYKSRLEISGHALCQFKSTSKKHLFHEKAATMNFDFKVKIELFVGDKIEKIGGFIPTTIRREVARGAVTNFSIKNVQMIVREKRMFTANPRRIRKFLRKMLWKKLNTVLNDGLELPTPEKIDFLSPRLQILDQTTVRLATDLKIA